LRQRSVRGAWIFFGVAGLVSVLIVAAAGLQYAAAARELEGLQKREREAARKLAGLPASTAGDEISGEEFLQRLAGLAENCLVSLEPPQMDLYTWRIRVRGDSRRVLDFLRVVENSSISVVGCSLSRSADPEEVVLTLDVVPPRK
jgi:hypothetical protein